jgi:hypothetical protein
MTLIAIVNDDAVNWAWELNGRDYDDLPITPETRSKKAFKAFVEANPDADCLIDPSVRFHGMPKDRRLFSPREALGRGPQADTIMTNHPRRTWFGTLTRAKDGTITVK